MTTKAKPRQLLVDAFNNETPKNPALNTADKAYLRGLIRRGFTHDEIVAIAAKHGVKVVASDLVVKTKKKTVKTA